MVWAADDDPSSYRARRDGGSLTMLLLLTPMMGPSDPCLLFRQTGVRRCVAVEGHSAAR